MLSAVIAMSLLRPSTLNWFTVRWGCRLSYAGAEWWRHAATSLTFHFHLIHPQVDANMSLSVAFVSMGFSIGGEQLIDSMINIRPTFTPALLSGLLVFPFMGIAGCVLAAMTGQSTSLIMGLALLAGCPPGHDHSWDLLWWHSPMHVVQPAYISSSRVSLSCLSVRIQKSCVVITLNSN
jgi:hypothetical protein